MSGDDSARYSGTGNDKDKERWRILLDKKTWTCSRRDYFIVDITMFILYLRREKIYIIMNKYFNALMRLTGKMNGNFITYSIWCKRYIHYFHFLKLISGSPCGICCRVHHRLYLEPPTTPLSCTSFCNQNYSPVSLSDTPYKTYLYIFIFS